MMNCCIRDAILFCAWGAIHREAREGFSNFFPQMAFFTVSEVVALKFEKCHFSWKLVGKHFIVAFVRPPKMATICHSWVEMDSGKIFSRKNLLQASK